MSTNIHASCVVLAGAAATFGAPADAGVLLLGESGSGKSDLALRLIARGARLVADDRTELFLHEGRLWARPVPSVAGLIEARGLGLVALPFMPGAQVKLVARLVAPDAVPRMPEAGTYEPPDELAPGLISKPPLVFLSAFEASAPDKIVLAAAAHANAFFRS